MKNESKQGKQFNMKVKPEFWDTLEIIRRDVPGDNTASNSKIIRSALLQYHQTNRIQTATKN